MIHATRPGLVLRSTDNAVQLRPLVPADAQTQFDLVNFRPDHILPYSGTPYRFESVEVIKDWITNTGPKQTLFGLWHTPPDRPETMVGGMDLTRRTDSNNASLAWWVGAQHLRAGYASRGGRALVKYAFEEAGIGYLSCRTDGDNVPSQRTAERIGFHLLSEDRAARIVYYGLGKRDPR
jgi:RimJ/RimL family protein N-acetyltransferase